MCIKRLYKSVAAVRNETIHYFVYKVPSYKNPFDPIPRKPFKECKMESLLKALGLLLYVALFPLFAITEIVMDVFVFVKYLISMTGRVRLAMARTARFFQSLFRYRLNLPWSLGKQ